MPRTRVASVTLSWTRATYRGGTNTIIFNQSYLNEDSRAIAAVLYHELTHAYQVYQGAGSQWDCVGMAVEAYGSQANAWLRAWDSRPPSRTALEEDLTLVAVIAGRRGEPGLYELVAGESSYQQLCELWLPSR